MDRFALHVFRISSTVYGTQLDDYPDDELDETSETVLQALRGQRRFAYESDFGDSWEHEVVIEETIRTTFGPKFAVCLDGQNAYPPEDCGGAGKYAELSEVLADPSNEDHDHFLSWVGGVFDPEAFDLG